MQRIFMKMQVIPEGREEYIRRHRLLMDRRSTTDPNATEEEIVLCEKTWDLHVNAGIKNYSIFCVGNDLYAYFEAEDYKKTLDIITKSVTGQEWQKYMDGFLVQENGVPVMEIADESVFYLD